MAIDVSEELGFQLKLPGGGAPPHQHLCASLLYLVPPPALYITNNTKYHNTPTRRVVKTSHTMEGVNIPLGGERKRQRSVSSSSSSGGSDMSPPLSPMSPTSFDYHHHLMHHRTSHGHVLGPADQNAASNAHSNGTNGNGNSNGNSKTKDAYASRPAPKYHRAPSPDRPFLCTLPPTCSQPGTSQAFASQADLDAHQDRLHRWMCRVPIRDKPGRVGEGEPVLILPEQFAGRGPRGGTHGQRWRECGKVFPEERLLDLVRGNQGRG